MTIGEIQQKIKEYNAQINNNHFMVNVSEAVLLVYECVASEPSCGSLHCSRCSLQNKDGSYTGFIRVQFQLARPVSLPSPRKLSQAQEGRARGGSTRRTSFYLPRDSAKHLHISSRTRAREVIQALLNKFTVVDNPAKFALFERTERQNQGDIMRVLLHLAFR